MDSKYICTILNVPIYLNMTALIMIGLLFLVIPQVGNLNQLNINFLFKFLIVIATILIFYGSILAHEFGHVLTARYYVIITEYIELHVFGAMAFTTINRPIHAKQQFIVALNGPLVSLCLFLVFYLIDLLVSNLQISNLLYWLARFNLIVGLFNLLPCFPLDGGNIFNAILWKLSNNYLRSMKTSILVGVVCTSLMIIIALTDLILVGNIELLFVGNVGIFLLLNQIDMIRNIKHRESEE